MSQWINWGDGSDGSPNAISGTVNTYATCTGTAGQTVLTTALAASEGDQILVHQTQHATAAGTWEIVKVVSDAGATLNLYSALVNSYSTGAQAVLIPQYSGGDISGAVTGTAWNGTVGGITAIMSNGDLTVSGSITPPSGFLKGGAVGGVGTGKQGDGTIAAGGTQSGNANGNGGGGGPKGAGDAAAGGGGGGNGTAGGNGNVGQAGAAGTGGAAAGAAALTTMVFGGAGGSGGFGNRDASNGLGGNGSGIVLIIAKNITITGTIPLTGSVGENGTADSAYWTGGGGGAGGSCLIKCQVAVLGTNRITAAGGVGGTGSNGSGWWNYGGDGGVGRIRCDYFTSITGSTTPTLSSAQDLTLNVQQSGAFAFF